jgi:hypothetical protein
MKSRAWIEAGYYHLGIHACSHLIIPLLTAVLPGTFKGLTTIENLKEVKIMAQMNSLRVLKL